MLARGGGWGSQPQRAAQVQIDQGISRRCRAMVGIAVTAVTVVAMAEAMAEAIAVVVALGWAGRQGGVRGGAVASEGDLRGGVTGPFVSQPPPRW